MWGKRRQVGEKGDGLSSSKSFSLWERTHRRVLINWLDWQPLILSEHPSSQLRPLASRLATSPAPWGAVASSPLEGQLGSTWSQHTEKGMLNQENTRTVISLLKLLSPLSRQSILFSAQERPNVYWLWVLVQIINPMLCRGWSQTFSHFPSWVELWCSRPLTLALSDPYDWMETWDEEHSVTLGEPWAVTCTSLGSEGVWSTIWERRAQSDLPAVPLEKCCWELPPLK